MLTSTQSETLKERVTEQLKEMDLLVDDELADYVVVLVGNGKAETEIAQVGAISSVPSQPSPLTPPPQPIFRVCGPCDVRIARPSHSGRIRVYLRILLLVAGSCPRTLVRQCQSGMCASYSGSMFTCLARQHGPPVKSPQEQRNSFPARANVAKPST